MGQSMNLKEPVTDTLLKKNYWAFVRDALVTSEPFDGHRKENFYSIEWPFKPTCMTAFDWNVETPFPLLPRRSGLGTLFVFLPQDFDYLGEDDCDWSPLTKLEARSWLIPTSIHGRELSYHQVIVPYQHLSMFPQKKVLCVWRSGGFMPGPWTVDFSPLQDRMDRVQVLIFQSRSFTGCSIDDIIPSFHPRFSGIGLLKVMVCRWVKRIRHKMKFKREVLNVLTSLPPLDGFPGGSAYHKSKKEFYEVTHSFPS